MNTIWLHPSQGQPFAAVAGFINDRIGAELAGWRQGTILAVADDSAIVGAVLFHNFNESAGVIEISAASDSKRWLTRPVLNEMFAFPFDQIGCQAVIARMDADRPLTRIFTAYGFKRYDIPRLRGRDRAEAVMVLADDDWRQGRFSRSKSHG